MVNKTILTILTILIWILAIAFAIGILGLLMTVLYAGLWQIVFVPLVVLIYFAWGWASSDDVRRIVTPFNGIFLLVVVLLRIAWLKLNRMTIGHFDIPIYNSGAPTLAGILAECLVDAASVLVLFFLFHVADKLCKGAARIVGVAGAGSAN